MTLHRKTGLARTKPMRKVGASKAKRRQRNADYYKSAEWRSKRKAVFERDGYRCTENLRLRDIVMGEFVVRCSNSGEIVNGKRTARGLVCEEVSYGHRGIPDRINTCRTRCKDCDRRLTPLERVNHRYGFAG